MSEAIPFEIYDDNYDVDLTPVSLGTDHPNIGSFSALIIFRHMITNMGDLEQNNSQHRYENSAINIPTQLYSTTNGKYKSCSICIEDFNDDDDIIILECEHIFHGSCIEEWGHYKGNCPICRTDVEKENLESL
jgi:hypothetical protein